MYVIPCHPEGVPEELRRLRHWVAYMAEPAKKPGGKFNKIPVDPHTGRNASTTDSATWGTFAQALDRATKNGLAGVGFVFTDSGYAGVDLDHCRHPMTGEIDPWALKIIERFATYTEVSPSGTGVHCIVRGKLAGRGRKYGNVEVYDTGRYFTVTGQRVPGTSDAIADGQTALDELVASFARNYVLPLEQNVVPPRTGVVPGPKPSVASDEVSIAAWRGDPEFNALWLGDFAKYRSQSEADIRLCSLIAKRVGNDAARIDAFFRQSGLFRSKWDQSRGATTYGAGTIQKVVDAAHATVCVPPIAGTGPPPKDHRVGRTLTDTGNAERLVAQHGDDLRYCGQWSQWLAWRGGRWVIDHRGLVMEASKFVARAIYAEAKQAADPGIAGAIEQHAKSSERAERRMAMVKLARYERGIPIEVSQLDSHPHLFNCRNGVLDLTTFELKPHRREDYLTKFCPTVFDAAAACPRWLAFLERVVPDDEIRAYLQRFVGYALTGDVSEQAMLLGVGYGLNGKSTFANAVQDVLSLSYAIQIAGDLLIAKDQRNHPTEIADLFGVRLAFGIETAKNQKLDEALVKQLTGGDPLRARRMREDFWQFNPTHKLMLLTNHMPSVVGREHAIWRRLHRVDFDVRIRQEELDRQLFAKLKSEREGILAWMVRGTRMWREEGLNPPEGVQLEAPAIAVVLTPAEHFVSRFVLARPGCRARARDIYNAYLTWSKSCEEPPVSQQEFGTLLGARGHGSKKSGGVMVYVDTDLVGEDRGQEGQPTGFHPLGDHSPGSNTGGGPSCPRSSPKAHSDTPDDDSRPPAQRLDSIDKAPGERG